MSLGEARAVDCICSHSRGQSSPELGRLNWAADPIHPFGNVTHSPWRRGAPLDTFTELLAHRVLPLDLSKHFGAAVRKHRTLVRLSQEDLAERAELDRTYVSGIERGRRNPSLRILQQIAEALGADLDVIFATARQIAREESNKD
ncbi:MAG: XRE family transcriptional regulator [Mesorhizobium sp.]|nr:MAG: XRE family transcriptional regulator [Mesorhizobium sp.]